MNEVKKDWKYYLGIVLFSISWFPYIFVFGILPFLRLSTAMALSVASVALVSAEVMFALSVVLLGKTIIDAIKKAVRSIFGNLFSFGKPAGRKRYTLGIIMLITSLIYPTLVTEIILLFDLLPMVGKVNLILILFSGDVLFVASFFILGSNFFQKIKSIFEWPKE